MNLLALPCAGASATMYLRWRRSLPASLRVVPAELPGRGMRLDEPLHENFDTLVAQICDDYAPQLVDDYALFGHSMGALLAYGVVQQLRRRSMPLPRALFLSACSAPSRRDPGYFEGKDSDAALIADLRKQGGTPQEIFDSSEWLRITLDTLRADYRVCESFHYEKQRPLPLPIHVLAGRSDDIAADCIEAWREEAGNGFALHWFDGGHFYLRQHEREVLAVIEHALLNNERQNSSCKHG